MGDILFVIKMTIYTLIIVVILQVKVGPSTLEEKVYSLTHQSEFAGVLQGVAQGAATFVGIQYNNLAGQVSSKYLNRYSSSQRPGDRLQNKIDDLKESLNKTWKEAESQKENIQENIQGEKSDIPPESI